jgi:hypothetical protein
MTMAAAAPATMNSDLLHILFFNTLPLVALRSHRHAEYLTHFMSHNPLSRNEVVQVKIYSCVGVAGDILKLRACIIITHPHSEFEQYLTG